MRLKVLHVYRQSKRRRIKIRGYLFQFSASLYFWLGATDQFRSDKKWYWVQTEQNIKTGYSDWYRTEPDSPGIYKKKNDVFLTSSNNPVTNIFVSRIYLTSLDNSGTNIFVPRIFTLLRLLIRILISGFSLFSLAVCKLMVKFVSFFV